MFAILVLISIFFFGCSTPPMDNTPVWSDNNRHAIEFENDCNLTTHSLGITGCAYKGTVRRNRIIIPAFADGSIRLHSQNCMNFSVNTYKDRDTILYTDELINNQNFCSYSLVQRINNINDSKYALEAKRLSDFGYVRSIVDDSDVYELAVLTILTFEKEVEGTERLFGINPHENNELDKQIQLLADILYRPIARRIYNE